MIVGAEFLLPFFRFLFLSSFVSTMKWGRSFIDCRITTHSEPV